MDQHARHAADALAALGAFGSFFGWLLGWLPVGLTMVASSMSIIWLGMQMRDRAERKRRERETIVSDHGTVGRTIEMGDA